MMAEQRPSYAQLWIALQGPECGCVIREDPIFPGPDNEDGPKLKRMVNPKNEKCWVGLDRYHGREQELVGRSAVDNIRRLLGLDLQDLRCGNGKWTWEKQPRSN